MPISSNSFQLTPKPRHHASRLIILLVVLAIIVLVVWLLIYVFTPNTNTKVNEPQTAVAGEVSPVPQSQTVTLSNQQQAARTALIKQVQQQNSETVILTPAQQAARAALLKSVQQANSK